MTFDHWFVAGIGFTAGFFTAWVTAFVGGWLRQSAKEWADEIEEDGRSLQNSRWNSSHGWMIVWRLISTPPKITMRSKLATDKNRGRRYLV